MMELRSRRTDTETVEEEEEEEEEELSELPSGLSALIEAATLQLGHLIEDPTDPPTVSPPPPGSSIGPHHSFPERLMKLCSNPEYINVITFLPDGKFFAVRVNAFCETLLPRYFEDLSTFDHFVTRAEQWGFSKLGRDGIAIFRHPSFVQGDYTRCSAIQFGERASAVRLLALPDRARSMCGEDSSTTNSSPNSHATTTTAQQIPQSQTKRQLSPRSRLETLSSVVASKARVEPSATALMTAPSLSTVGHDDDPNNNNKSLMDEDSVRSVAMAITTDRLKLQPDTTCDQNTLVETAVSSATQEIVTEAIESLLRDEGHSKETFLKHEKELSRSSIPGVVPVCKQLFCSTYKDALQIVSMDQTQRVFGTDTVVHKQEPHESPYDSQRTGNIREEEKVLKEASNSPSTTYPTINLDDRKGLPKNIPDII
jgi:HSF-type DNA-binding